MAVFEFCFISSEKQVTGTSTERRREMLLKKSRILRSALVLLQSRMSSGTTTHLERTADVKRLEILSAAKVTHIHQESPTVKKLRLQIENDKFTFKAGQWVDFIIPKQDIVGGFSMCSSPRLLEESRELDLAIKYSEHRPAHWVHKQCQIGDVIIVKAGGECIWDPKDVKQKRNTLLIAGGIGINPIYSILQHIEETRRSRESNDDYLGKATLLYSASTRDELIFKEHIDALRNGSEKFSCRYFITKDRQLDGNCTQDTQANRIRHEDIQEAVHQLTDNKGLQCFLCGPPPMIQSMVKCLKKSGMNESDIHFEQWW